MIRIVVRGEDRYAGLSLDALDTFSGVERFENLMETGAVQYARLQLAQR